MPKTKNKISDEFYHGVIACLAVIALHDQPVIFDEIIRTIDENKLIRVARKNGDMRWSGLTRYGYGKKHYINRRDV